MPSEPTGPGYQGPPTAGGNIPGEERIRALEDFLSRRIKARCRISSPYSAPNTSGGTIPWDIVEYDTSGLYVVHDGHFTVPPGADGDYLALVQATVVNSSATVYASRISLRMGSPEFGSGYRVLGQSFAETAGDPNHNVMGEATLRAGDSVYAHFTPGNATSLSIQSASSTFMAVRRLV